MNRELFCITTSEKGPGFHIIVCPNCLKKVDAGLSAIYEYYLEGVDEMEELRIYECPECGRSFPHFRYAKTEGNGFFSYPNDLKMTPDGKMEVANDQIL